MTQGCIKLINNYSKDISNITKCHCEVSIYQRMMGKMYYSFHKIIKQHNITDLEHYA